MREPERLLSRLPIEEKKKSRAIACIPATGTVITDKNHGIAKYKSEKDNLERLEIPSRTEALSISQTPYKSSLLSSRPDPTQIRGIEERYQGDSFSLSFPFYLFIIFTF